MVIASLLPPFPHPPLIPPAITAPVVKPKRKPKMRMLIPAILMTGGAVLLAIAKRSADKVSSKLKPVKTGGGGRPENLKVIISTMGLRGKEIDGWTIIEWPGEVAPGKVHPSWSNVAQKLRDSQGRILPNLLAKYGISFPSQIGAVGFSAGSNSGLREILRSPLDRDALAFAVGADGIHAMLKPGKENEPSPEPADFSDWRSQMSPVGEMALSASKGRAPFVLTASGIVSPAKSVSSSGQGLAAVRNLIAMDGDVRVWKNVTGYIDLPNHSATQTGNFYSVKTEGKDAAEHIRHARSIPSILRTWVFPNLQTVSS